MLKVQYTSAKLQSQIYIGSVNWFLLVAVIFVMLIFRESNNLAAAYGLAVMGSMTTTALMMVLIFSRYPEMEASDRHQCLRDRFRLSLLVLHEDPARRILVPHDRGGSAGRHVDLDIGQKLLYRSLRPLPFDIFKTSYEQIYASRKGAAGYGPLFHPRLEGGPPLCRSLHLSGQHHLRTEYFHFDHQDGRAFRGRGP